MAMAARLFANLLLLLGLFTTATAQLGSPSPAQPVTTIDGGLGRCSLEVTVSTPAGKPAAGANVKVHIAYGFGGFHKLDLEAGTNVDGKVKFTGLPANVRRPPLEFRASSEKDQLTGNTTYDPAAQCHAERSISLTKTTATQP
jgi:hypothetical protein